METDSLTYKTLKNLGYSFAGYGWSFIFALVITPIIVLKLGVREYGVFIFIMTVSSLFGLLELGVATASQKYLAEYSAGEERLKLRHLIGSINTLFLGIGTVGLLGISLVGVLGCRYFSCVSDSAISYPLLFFIAGVTFFVESLNSMAILVPTSLQRFDIATKIGTTKSTLTQITILILVITGHSLLSIFIATLCFSILFFVLYLRAAKQLLAEATMHFSYYKEQVQKLYAFGLSLVVNNISTNTLVHLDRFLIPIVLGPSQLSYYSLPGTISSKIPGLTNTISTVIFPVTTHVLHSGDHDQLTRVYLRSIRLVTILSAAMSAALLIYAPGLLRYWLNEDFARISGPVLMIFAGIAFLLSLQAHVSNFLYGIGELKVITRISVIMAVSNAVLLVILLPLYGITGAAWAYLISLLPVLYLLYHIEVAHLHLRNFFTRNLKLYGKLVLTGMALFILAKIAIVPLLTSLIALIIIGPVSVLIYLVLYRVFGFFEQEDVQTVRDFSQIMFRRMSVWKK